MDSAVDFAAHARALAWTVAQDVFELAARGGPWRHIVVSKFKLRQLSCDQVSIRESMVLLGISRVCWFG